MKSFGLTIHSHRPISNYPQKEAPYKDTLEHFNVIVSIHKRKQSTARRKHKVASIEKTLAGCDHNIVCPSTEAA